MQESNPIEQCHEDFALNPPRAQPRALPTSAMVLGVPPLMAVVWEALGVAKVAVVAVVAVAAGQPLAVA